VIGGYEVRWDRIGAAIAVVVVAGFLVWYFAIRDNGNSGSTQTTSGTVKSIGPEATTPTGLSGVSKRLGQPIYWAGSQPNTKLEFTRSTVGRLYVRYLPAGVKVGQRTHGYLTVATFPFNGAYHALKVVAKQPGAIVKQGANDGLVVTNKHSPIYVFVAYPGKNYEIEVYDPDPNRALSIAQSGSLRPIR